MSRKRLKNLVFLVLSALSALILLATPKETALEGLFALPAQALEIRLLNVGQGDAILLRCGGESMLIDAGTEDSGTAERLREMGITKLDYAIATHPHADHIGGMSAVLKQFSPKQYLYTDYPYSSYTYGHTMAFAKEFAGELRAVSAGDSFRLGEARVHVLSPQKGAQPKEVNDCSAVVLVEYDCFSALFTGDAQAGVEKELLAQSLPDVDFLKVGHHGSYTSTTNDFLAAIKPEYGGISLGKDNEYGFPHERVLKSLKKYGVNYFRTDQDGELRFLAEINEEGKMVLHLPNGDAHTIE